MKKKLMIGCIGIIFMLVTITMVSAVSDNTTEKKESPLYKLRTNRATNLKIKEFIKTRFTQNRLFLFRENVEYDKDLSIIDMMEAKWTTDPFNYFCQTVGYLTACHCQHSDSDESNEDHSNFMESKFPCTALCVNTYLTECTCHNR